MSRRDEQLREIERKKREMQREKDFQLTRTLVMSFFLSTLNKEFGFGNKRLMKLLELAEKEASFIECGMISVEDYIQSVRERTGIVIDDIER